MKELDWKNEKRKLGELTPANYNPRKISEEQKTQLLASLEKFGLAEIPVINTTGTIVAGHQRIAILKDIWGDDYEIDVRIPDRELTRDEEREYNIRSNKNTGSWNYDLLHEHFSNDELIGWGFEEYDLKQDLISPDELTDSEFSPKQKTAKTCPHCGEEL